jgi:CYTH domain-containing protein
MTKRPPTAANKKKQNKVPLEIERKLLLKRFPKAVIEKYKKNLQVLNIVQYYFFIDNIWQRFRQVKSTGKKTKYIHTIKGRAVSLGACPEDEKTMNEKLFKQVLRENNKNYAVIRKTRYVIKYKGFKFEIDVYQDLAIVTLEVELPSINHHFEYPDGLLEQVLMDVTGMKQFSNLNLSKKIQK